MNRYPQPLLAVHARVMLSHRRALPTKAAVVLTRSEQQALATGTHESMSSLTCWSITHSMSSHTCCPTGYYQLKACTALPVCLLPTQCPAIPDGPIPTQSVKRVQPYLLPLFHKSLALSSPTKLDSWFMYSFSLSSSSSCRRCSTRTA